MFSLLEQQILCHNISQPESTDEWKMDFQNGWNPKKNALDVSQSKQLCGTRGKERDSQGAAVASYI